MFIRLGDAFEMHASRLLQAKIDARIRLKQHEFAINETICQKLFIKLDSLCRIYES